LGQGRTRVTWPMEGHEKLSLGGDRPCTGNQEGRVGRSHWVEPLVPCRPEEWWGRGRTWRARSGGREGANSRQNTAKVV
jgi:hypothetical protein